MFMYSLLDDPLSPLRGLAFHGDFTPVLAKHTKHLSLVDILSVGVDRMQRNFEPMRRQVETRRARQLLMRLRSSSSYQF
jgi:hypothetical protein